MNFQVGSEDKTLPSGRFSSSFSTERNAVDISRKNIHGLEIVNHSRSKHGLRFFTDSIFELVPIPGIWILPITILAYLLLFRECVGWIVSQAFGKK